jgi:alanine dehydrogenase
MASRVVILGAGVVGSNAAKIAAGMGADVRIFDVRLDRLRYLDDVMPPNVRTIKSEPAAIRDAIAEADLVIAAVLLPGRRTPVLIRREDLRHMKQGSVIVDVGVDQGGSVETSRPTTHHDPTYQVEGVVHYCVTNMPGAVPRTSTLALANATLPYVQHLADAGWRKAADDDPHLAAGVNIVEGQITCPGVAEAHALKLSPLRP